MDQLRNALRGALGDAAPAATPATPVAPDPLPDPYASDWIALLRRYEPVPAGMTLGQLVQRSDARSRALKEGGRGRDAAELKKAREDYGREREKRAWAAVKARFEELALPEKAYRALKQEEADAEKVLVRLRGKRGEELRGAGAARVRDALLD